MFHGQFGINIRLKNGVIVVVSIELYFSFPMTNIDKPFSGSLILTHCFYSSQLMFQHVVVLH